MALASAIVIFYALLTCVQSLVLLKKVFGCKGFLADVALPLLGVQSLLILIQGEEAVGSV